MAAVKRGSRRRPDKEAPAPRVPGRQRLALVVFGLLVVGGPLAFGAVDRFTQIALLGLFAVGLWARPAVTTPLSRWGNRLVVALIAVLLVKEFAPALWFGGVHWRSALVENFGLALPWTHSPEPARAFDALLTCSGAVLWFMWVRTLASDRESRPIIAWALVAAGAVITAVAFSTRGMDPQAIYGLRFTPGWTGFGPFPNRNHTADLLAVAFVFGCGCTAWAAVRNNRSAVAAGLILTVINLLGLLGTQSRGGLLAGVAGVGCFALLALARFRNRRTLLAVGLGALVLAVAAASFGADVLERFQSKEGGQVSNLMRVQIWQDTLRMWRDAPLFGHGWRTFPQIIGLYQTLRLEDQEILHPESSWLLWLAELGLVPVLLAVAGVAVFLAGQIRAAFGRERGFFLRAAAFSAFAVLVVHSAIDVPAHRWGTLGFALAALAVGCPLSVPGRLPAGSRRAALVPLGVALFWTLPFFTDWPRWSPLSLARVLAREDATSAVPLEELEASARCFPLSAELHQALGIRQVRILGRAKPTVWQRHFGIASALIPGSWSLVAAQARGVATVAPGLAIGYWQQALERCDLHREEVLGIGVRETLTFPTAATRWGRYVEDNPPLLLPYAQWISEEQARYFYSIWWQTRALTAHLSPSELQLYYQNASHWGTRTQFDDWMRERAVWERRDHRLWAALLHQWGDEKRAFDLLAAHLPEPEFPKNLPPAGRDSLEVKWRTSPKNVVNAQFFAHALHLAGETEQSDEIIVAVAQKDYAPPWFTLKAGYILSRRGRYGEAVEVMLRKVK